MEKQTKPGKALIEQRDNEGPNLIAVLRDHLPQQTRWQAQNFDTSRWVRESV